MWADRLMERPTRHRSVIMLLLRNDGNCQSSQAPRKQELRVSP